MHLHTLVPDICAAAASLITYGEKFDPIMSLADSYDVALTSNTGGVIKRLVKRKWYEKSY